MDTTSADTVRETDVLICGGGPAGALLAGLLARQGIEVVLVEKQANAERNFRGETISATSVRSLFMLGYGPALEAHGYLEQTGIVMRENGRRIFGIDYRRLSDGFLPIDIPQPGLIEIFLEDARRHPSFTMLSTTALSDLLVEDGEVRGAVLTGRDRSPTTIRARLVVGADGRFSKTRKLSGLEATVRDMPRDFLWFKVPRPADWTRDGELMVSGNRNLVILPTFPDLLRVGFNLPKRGFSQLRKQGFDAFVGELAVLDPRLGPVIAEHVRSFADTSFLEIFTAYVPQWSRDGLLLIGDAAHTSTPILGQGVNLALQDSVGAAHLLGRYLRSHPRGVVPARALSDFVARRKQHKERVTALQEVQERSLAAGGRLAGGIRRARMSALDRLPLKYTLLARALNPPPGRWELDLTQSADLAEAKRHVLLHAGHMGIGTEVRRVLDTVTRLDGSGRTSWLGELSTLADRREWTTQQRADLLNLARFPCADDEHRRVVAARASALLAEDLAGRGAGERRVASVDGTGVPFLFRSAGADSPLLVVMGGIVSIKEQWAPFLGLGARLGCSVAVVDFPGAGENTLRYQRSAAALLTGVMDAVAPYCRATSTMVIAPSFGGHLSLLAAGRDSRITRLLTIDVPLRHFFRAAADGASLPLITRRALAHSCGLPVNTRGAAFADLALTQEDLERVRIPVDAVVSSRDDIVPATDWQWARDHASGFQFHHFDDEHGAPRHARQVRLLAAGAVLRHANRRAPGAVVGTLTSLARRTGRLPQPVGSRPGQLTRTPGAPVPAGADRDTYQADGAHS